MTTETETDPERKRMKMWPLDLPNDPDVRGLIRDVTISNTGHLVITMAPGKDPVILRNLTSWDSTLLNIPVLLSGNMLIIELARIHDEVRILGAEAAEMLRFRRKKEAKIEDQPPPRPSTSPPAWELLIKHMRQRAGDEWGFSAMADRVIADMHERDEVGRERYGTRLRANNGRDHLVDAYQEALDFAVYLTAWLDERGHEIGEPVPIGKTDSKSWHAFSVQSMLYEHQRVLLRLCALIDDVAAGDGAP